MIGSELSAILCQTTAMISSQSKENNYLPPAKLYTEGFNENEYKMNKAFTQTHNCNKTGYCIRTTKEGNTYCRFGFDKDKHVLISRLVKFKDFYIYLFISTI